MPSARLVTHMHTVWISGYTNKRCPVQSLIYAGQIMEDDNQLQDYKVPPVSNCASCLPVNAAVPRPSSAYYMLALSLSETTICSRLAAPGHGATSYHACSQYLLTIPASYTKESMDTLHSITAQYDVQWRLTCRGAKSASLWRPPRYMLSLIPIQHTGTEKIYQQARLDMLQLIGQLSPIGEGQTGLLQHSSTDVHR